VLLSFNVDDGSNTVAIGASIVPDLPMLVTGAEIGLESGDNIIVMYLGNSAMIVGKIASVGGSNYGASSAGRDAFLHNATNFGSANAGVTVATDSSITVPDWAHSCLLTMTGMATLHNSTASLDNITSQVRMVCPGQDDQFSGFVDAHAPAGQLSATYALFTNNSPVVPGNTLTFTYVVSSGTTWATDAGAQAIFMCQIQFFRESVS
jgi:hypothetical protein